MKSLISFLLLFATVTLTAQPGTLDNSFGTGGKVIENFSASKVYELDMLQQTDGKLLVLAEAEYNHISRLVLVRYNTNGVLDNSFDNDGIMDNLLPPANVGEYPAAIKLQADSKILVCGMNYNYPYETFVVRYNTNGSPDNTFGTNGIVYFQYPDDFNMRNLLVLPGGQIVLLGNIYTSVGTRVALVKLNPDGSRFAGFGINGIATVLVDDAYYSLYNHIALQADGKFIVGGVPGLFSGPNTYHPLLARMNANGTIDNTFGTNGIVETDPGPAEQDFLVDIALQPDGKIMISGGNVDNPSDGYLFIARFKTNGLPDSTFGTNGMQLINSSYSFLMSGKSDLQADGKIILSGSAMDAQGNYQMAAARLLANGSFDSAFDNDGIAVIGSNNYGSRGHIARFQPDGKIAIAGFASTNGKAFSINIGRLTSSGQPDNTINPVASIAPVGNGSFYETGETILVQPDQKIINVRHRENNVTADITLSRHLPNGMPDNSFGTNGISNMNLPGSYSSSFSGLLSNGKIMAVFDFHDYVKGEKVGVVRFNSGGYPDSTFGTNGKLFLTTSHTSENQVIDAAVQADGKTVIITRQNKAAIQLDSTYIIRLNADGTYDNTWNGNGKLLLNTPMNDGKVMVQADGKIILEQYDNGNTNLRRFNSNGTPDVGFNNGNAVVIPLTSSVKIIGSDGKILLAGPQGKLVRLTSNGNFDSTFDTDGIAEPAYLFSTLTDIEIQPDGKILLGGSHIPSGFTVFSFQAVRINNNGSLDATFGANGAAQIEVAAGKRNYSEAIALQADGKILLTGYTYDEMLDYNDFAMIRLNNNVSPVYTFTGNGAWDVAANWSNNIIPPATLPSGSIILIDPITGGECVLTVTQHVSAGANFTVKSGKKFRVAGSLILQ